MSSSPRWRAWSLLTLAVLLWGLPGIVIYYLAHRGGFSTQAMNFYRYGAGAPSLEALADPYAAAAHRVAARVARERGVPAP